jgi:hypothetical protein
MGLLFTLMWSRCSSWNHISIFQKVGKPDVTVSWIPQNWGTDKKSLGIGVANEDLKISIPIGNTLLAVETAHPKSPGPWHWEEDLPPSSNNFGLQLNPQGHNSWVSFFSLSYNIVMAKVEADWEFLSPQFWTKPNIMTFSLTVGDHLDSELDGSYNSLSHLLANGQLLVLLVKINW